MANIACGIALGWLSVGMYLAALSLVRAWWDSVPTMEREEFERWVEAEQDRRTAASCAPRALPVP